MMTSLQLWRGGAGDYSLSGYVWVVSRLPSKSTSWTRPLRRMKSHKLGRRDEIERFARPRSNRSFGNDYCSPLQTYSASLLQSDGPALHLLTLPPHFDSTNKRLSIASKPICCADVQFLMIKSL